MNGQVKPDRYWKITFHQDGNMIGPAWEVKSKIKPTKWAKGHVYEGCSYLIEEVVASVK